MMAHTLQNIEMHICYVLTYIYLFLLASKQLASLGKGKSQMHTSWV
jgi:hypothetical protein